MRPAPAPRGPRRATPSAPSPGFCATGGFGGAFFQDLVVPSSPDTGTGLADSHDFAWGTCRVESGLGVPAGGQVFFVCATDRDDDGMVTSEDGLGADYAHCQGERLGGSGDCVDGFDDDFVRSDTLGVDVPFCFARDREFPSLHTDGLAGGDWDEFYVLVGWTGRVPFTGFLDVYIEATNGESCPDGLRSGHSHDDYDAPLALATAAQPSEAAAEDAATPCAFSPVPACALAASASIKVGPTFVVGLLITP